MLAWTLIENSNVCTNPKHAEWFNLAKIPAK